MVDDGIQVALEYAVPVAKRIRFELSEEQVNTAPYWTLESAAQTRTYTIKG